MRLKIGNGLSVDAKAIRSTSLVVHNHFDDHVLYLKDVFYVLNMYKNIISVSSMTRDGYEFRFINDVCTVYYSNKIICLGYLQNGIYYINNQCKTAPSTEYEINATENINLNPK